MRNLPSLSTIFVIFFVGFVGVLCRYVWQTGESNPIDWRTLLDLTAQTSSFNSILLIGAYSFIYGLVFTNIGSAVERLYSRDPTYFQLEARFAHSENGFLQSLFREKRLQSTIFNGVAVAITVVSLSHVPQWSSMTTEQSLWLVIAPVLAITALLYGFSIYCEIVGLVNEFENLRINPSVKD